MVVSCEKCNVVSYDGYDCGPRWCPKRKEFAMYVPYIPSESGVDRKPRKDKPRFSLVPMRELWDVVKAFSDGAKKHGDRTWEHAKDPEIDYGDALMRHFADWCMGSTKDPESGFHPLAHVICNCLILMWHDNEGKA